MRCWRALANAPPHLGQSERQEVGLALQRLGGTRALRRVPQPPTSLMKEISNERPRNLAWWDSLPTQINLETRYYGANGAQNWQWDSGGSASLSLCALFVSWLWDSGGSASLSLCLFVSCPNPYTNKFKNQTLNLKQPWGLITKKDKPCSRAYDNQDFANYYYYYYYDTKITSERPNNLVWWDSLLPTCAHKSKI